MTRFEPSVLRASALAIIALGLVVRRAAGVEPAARWRSR